MDQFIRSRFGAFLDRLFKGLFTKPSHETFLILALGFALSPTRHSVANYLWRAGATAYKHFTCFYGDGTSPIFLGAPFYRKLTPLWERLIRAAVAHRPAAEVLEVVFDETTRKKPGKRIEGPRPIAMAPGRPARSFARASGCTLSWACYGFG